MNKVEIDIQLNPLMDGISQIVDATKLMYEDKVALIIGTNGKYRIADQMEVWDLIDLLLTTGGNGCCLGKTDYFAIYNENKVLHLDGVNYLVGSAIIVKRVGNMMNCMRHSEIDVARKEFESRLTVLCGGGSRFSALEIG